MSHSSNEPGSSSSSMRSRAVSLPLACCASMRSAPPPSRAALRRFSSSSSIFCIHELRLTRPFCGISRYTSTPDQRLKGASGRMASDEVLVATLRDASLRDAPQGEDRISPPPSPLPRKCSTTGLSGCTLPKTYETLRMANDRDEAKDETNAKFAAIIHCGVRACFAVVRRDSGECRHCGRVGRKRPFARQMGSGLLQASRLQQPAPNLRSIE